MICLPSDERFQYICFIVAWSVIASLWHSVSNCINTGHILTLLFFAFFSPGLLISFYIDCCLSELCRSFWTGTVVIVFLHNILKVDLTMSVFLRTKDICGVLSTCKTFLKTVFVFYCCYHTLSPSLHSRLCCFLKAWMILLSSHQLMEQQGVITLTSPDSELSRQRNLAVADFISYSATYLLVSMM